MEPVILILTALASGGAALATSTISEAGKDIYLSLKERIRRRFVNKPQHEIVLAEFEKDPKTWEKPLMKALTETSANQDKEIIQAAQQFMAVINPQQAAMGKFNVQISGDVQGLVQGDNAQVNMTFSNNAEESDS